MIGLCCTRQLKDKWRSMCKSSVYGELCVAAMAEYEARPPAAQDDEEENEDDDEDEDNNADADGNEEDEEDADE